jgi:hypothetical protein
MKASKSNGVDLPLLSPSTSAARSAANDSVLKVLQNL